MIEHNDVYDLCTQYIVRKSIISVNVYQTLNHQYITEYKSVVAFRILMITHQSTFTMLVKVSSVLLLVLLNCQFTFGKSPIVIGII